MNNTGTNQATESLRATLVPPRVTIAETVPHMINEAALVVDDSGRLAGLVTDGDLRRAFLNGANLDTPVSDVMTTDPCTLRRDASPEKILKTMLTKGIRHLPIVDADGRPVGLELFKEQLGDVEVDGAVVMAGGKGTRLRPLTLTTPKPLLRLGDATILDSVLKGLKNGGFADVVISVNYLGNQIKEHAGDGSAHELNIDYVTERKQLGTAGALALLDPRPENSFLVMNADLITDLDFRAFARFHRRHGNDFTVCVRRYTMQVPYGVVDLSEDGQRVNEIREKPNHEFFVNAGIYILEPDVIDLIPRGRYFDMTSLVEKAIAADYRVGAFPIIEYWRDIGRPREMAEAQAEWKRRPGSREKQKAAVMSVPVDYLAYEAV